MELVTENWFLQVSRWKGFKFCGKCGIWVDRWRGIKIHVVIGVVDGVLMAGARFPVPPPLPGASLARAAKKARGSWKFHEEIAHVAVHIDSTHPLETRNGYIDNLPANIPDHRRHSFSKRYATAANWENFRKHLDAPRSLSIIRACELLGTSFLYFTLTRSQIRENW